MGNATRAGRIRLGKSWLFDSVVGGRGGAGALKEGAMSATMVGEGDMDFWALRRAALDVREEDGDEVDEAEDIFLGRQIVGRGAWQVGGGISERWVQGGS